MLAASPRAAVAVAKAAVEPLSREIVITGEFRPYQVVDVHAKVAGYMRQIYVDVGDRVTAGQLLAILDIPEMTDELAQAKATRGRAEAELLRMKGELERAQANQSLIDLSWSRLVSVNKTEKGLVAQHEIDEALARKRAAEAQVAAAKASLTSAEQQIEFSRASEERTKTLSGYAQIVAPFAGVVTKRYADTGAMIQAGTASQTQAMPVVRIAQIDRLRMIIPVPESAAPDIAIGKQATIRVNSLGRSFSGKVSRFTSDVRSSTRTMDVEVDVMNPKGALIPGMYADAVLTLEHRQNAITVPVQALVVRDGKRLVMVVNAQGLVEDRPVEVGMERATRVEVVKGVAVDEMVIVGNKGQLKAGDKVEPKVVGIG